MNNLVKHVQSFFLEVNNVMIFSVIISLITTIIFMKKFYKGSSDREQLNNASDEDNKSSTDSEDESDEESNGIYARLKKAKFNKLRETLSEDQKQAEKEIEKQQLAAIFELLKRQQEELQLAGEVSEIDLKEQLSLYR
ncbi:matrix-remodeling-associated protein 7 [Culicoides brevitarsis]|uniref:matrix-remodeling-associated protein 7 n=1 Tax=Culicoides brevitarsis TaxID=469753 RepID=UPI00307BF466